VAAWLTVERAEEAIAVIEALQTDTDA